MQQLKRLIILTLFVILKRLLIHSCVKTLAQDTSYFAEFIV